MVVVLLFLLVVSVKRSTFLHGITSLMEKKGIDKERKTKGERMENWSPQPKTL